MGKKSSPCIYGEFWLDKRRDGSSPDIWQIAFIKSGTNSITYKSTKERDLRAAKQVIEKFYFNSLRGVRSIHKVSPPNPLQIPLVPELMRYWETHGMYAISADTIAHHIRSFLGFLSQDEVGLDCTFDAADKYLFEKYRLWAMSPHTFEVNWYGKTCQSRSKGLCGASYKRSLASIKAALNLALENRIVPRLWPIPKVPPEYRSAPRSRVMSPQEIGAMIGYATGDMALLNWIRVMLATGVRPMAAFQLVPSRQWLPQLGRLDLKPVGAPRTSKRNPIVPLIPELARIFDNHEGSWIPEGTQYQTLLRRWRVMREALGLSSEIVPKTLRHTVASYLDWADVDERYVAMLLGHLVPPIGHEHRIFSAKFATAIVPVLSGLWNEVHAEADNWRTTFETTRTGGGARIIVLRSTLSQGPPRGHRYRLTDAVSTTTLKDFRCARAPAMPDTYHVRDELNYGVEERSGSEAFWNRHASKRNG